ncbi:uncharacterized protein LOC130713139 [Lotus japonicus]|uniref:uncharacterized protein LOC130713139 n=1 Tax=Lotus japonicus TaxID=34305 RepID=UPI0025847E94|nr:uncharacterized protein LOC130713139 [Lotus japonicus]
MILDSYTWSLETAWRKLCQEHDECIRILEPDLMHDDNHQLMARWRPPSAGFLKLNSDGSYKEDAQVMGGVGLIRDSLGKWICGFISTYREATNSPFLAEALAMRDGLILAWERGVRNIICNSDCQELMQIARDSARAIHHVHGWVLTEIQNLLSRSW